MNKENILIILQARMSSTRLPFKSGALVNSFPLAILCALRLSNKGHKLILATSKDKSDDYLEKLCTKYKIKFFRGDLKNVLKRYIQCTSELDDNTIIVRATADNPLNDGKIVNYAIKQFKKNKLDYFSMPPKAANLPLGVGVEVFKLKKIREIYETKYNNYDQEHVTWKLAKNFIARKEYYTQIKLEKKSKYLNRVTVDNLLDYFKIIELFSNNKNSLKASWKAILKNKKKFKNYLKFNRNNFIKNKIILGGAQIGMNYGYKNEKIIKKKHLKKIFNLMSNKKINAIDTAQAYNLSEEKIGRQIENYKSKKKFYLFNKINKLENSKLIPDNFIKIKIYLDIYLSMFKLRTTTIDVMMIHSIRDFLKKKILFKNILLDLKKKKFVKNFGISIYNPNELLKILNQKFFKFIQIPFNIIDDRWNENKMMLLKKKYSFKIIARSIFLRGNLIYNNNWPKWFNEKKILDDHFNNIKKKFKIRNNLNLCAKYVNSIKFIDNIVVGCNNLKQFKQILFAFEQKKFIKSEIKKINKLINIRNKKILDARNF